MHDDIQTLYAALRHRELVMLLMLGLFVIGALCLAGLVAQWNARNHDRLAGATGHNANGLPAGAEAINSPGVRGESMKQFCPEDTIDPRSQIDETVIPPGRRPARADRTPEPIYSGRRVYANSAQR